MYNNAVHNKIIQLAAEDIGFTQFYDFLLQSNASEPIRIKWDTMEGNERYYFCYWQNGPVGTTEAGRKASATKQANGMYNLQVVGISGDWRTIDFNTVSACRFKGKLYRVT
jgi:membrane carboxypeptidase/penicillin-binding protein PbpC